MLRECCVCNLSNLKICWVNLEISSDMPESIPSDINLSHWCQEV